ncbi:MAG: hypothetical protein ACF8PN_08010 [Phycisphaerales bacterium]
MPTILTITPPEPRANPNPSEPDTWDIELTADTNPDRPIYRGTYMKGQGLRDSNGQPVAPTAGEIVASLILDARTADPDYTGDFWDFIVDYGYTIGDAAEGRRLHSMWQACADTRAAFLETLGADVYRWAVETIHDPEDLEPLELTARTVAIPTADELPVWMQHRWMCPSCFTTLGTDDPPRAHRCPDWPHPCKVDDGTAADLWACDCPDCTTLQADAEL